MTKLKTQTLRERNQALKDVFVSTSFRVGLIFAIAIFLVLDVLQMSRVSTKGHDISNLQKQISELQQETRRIEFQIAENRSMSSIQERLQKLDLVQAESPEYVVLAGSAVAIR